MRHISGMMHLVFSKMLNHYVTSVITRDLRTLCANSISLKKRLFCT